MLKVCRFRYSYVYFIMPIRICQVLTSRVLLPLLFSRILPSSTGVLDYQLRELSLNPPNLIRTYLRRELTIMGCSCIVFLDRYMNAQFIGQLSLSISFIFYCIYFFPQIWHNRKSENAAKISYWLQLIYVLGYSTDWLYGAAAHLQWQYRLVTLIGLVFLCYQQWQMRSNKYSYLLTLSAVTLMIVLSLTLSFLPIKELLPVNELGTISMLCAIFSFAPQLVRNYKQKNGQAISHVFIAFTLICAVLDMISAIYLHWPWPSLVSPPALFVLHIACWIQQKSYRGEQPTIRWIASRSMTRNKS